jgi:hypothetical protein
MEKIFNYRKKRIRKKRINKKKIEAAKCIKYDLLISGYELLPYLK